MADESLEVEERSTKLSIVNGALALLSNALANTVPETASDTAQTFERNVARLYPDAYDAVLQARPWFSARRSIALVAVDDDQDAATRANGFVRFRLPEDMLRFISVTGDQGARPQARVNGKDLLVRGIVGATIYVDYVKRVPEHDLVRSPLLRQAISTHLAARIARFMTDSASERTRLTELAEIDLESAWRAEAGQQGVTAPRQSRVLDAISNYGDQRQEHRFRS